MEIKDKIDNILQIRKKKADMLRSKSESLSEIHKYLGEIKSYKSNVMHLKDESLKNKYAEVFKKISTDEASKEIRAFRTRIDDARKRFERDYISIATIGRARQGKSKILQAIGNLDDNIIPAYDAGDCTGATSVIYNEPDMEPGKVSVIITFKNRDDLVKIVEEYINQIDPSYLSKNPQTFEDIPYINIDELEEYIAEHKKGDAYASVAMGHLNKIVENYDDISKLFGSAPITLTSPDEIKKYVAQNNGKAESDPDVEYYNKYLAVARAEIHCRFYEDCGKLVLVDTIGLGDTQVGIERAMLETLDKECDAAIVMTKPISGIHKEDLKLYEDLRDNFSQRSMSDWLFYVANHHKGHNDNAVELFEKDVKTKNFDINFCKTIDCSDKDDVNQNFMRPMLDALLKNMDRIDSVYLEELNRLNSNAVKKIEALISVLPELEEINAGKEASQQAFVMGQITYKNMTAQLKQQVFNLRKEKNQTNGALWSRVQYILNGMDDLVPNAEKLQGIINENGAMTPGALWDSACNYVRNEITDRFNEIDGIMEKETLNFKNSLVRPMYNSLHDILASNGGETVNVSEDENVDMLAWLKNIMDNVICGQEKYKQIYKAFQFLYQFEFSIKENVIQEVRRQLYTINPIAENYTAPIYNFSQNNTGEEVYYYLTSRLAIIEDELRHNLSQLYRRPNQIFYAAAEEFYDRITFAIDFDNKNSGFKGMDMVWGDFFMQYSEKIWEANSGRYEEINKIITKYNGTKLRLLDAVRDIRL